MSPGLLAGKDVVMVLRLGLWRLLVLASWMTYFLSLVILLGLVSLLLMVLLGCGIVLLTFLVRSLLGFAAFRWRGCSGFCCWCSSAGSSLWVLVLSSLGNIEGDGRKKIRLTKKD